MYPLNRSISEEKQIKTRIDQLRYYRDISPIFFPHKRLSYQASLRDWEQGKRHNAILHNVQKMRYGS